MKLTFLFLPLFFVIQSCQSKEIAITFDDSPREATGYFTGAERAQKLISELKKHQIRQVAFFSNSSKLDAEGIKRLHAYSKAGHIIANHTHNHVDFNEVSLKVFAQNFLLADSSLRQFNNFKKLFRFPYLREGNTKEKIQSMRDLLDKHGYINAYITLNNYDWHIETIFQKAIASGETVDFELMSRFYVQVLMESIEYYDEMARDQLNRSPKHVLLLHEMDVSALFVGDLVDALRRKGWKIIPPEEAYTDEIANYKVQYIFNSNPGRIGEIASGNGQKDGLWHKNLDKSYLEKRFSEEVLIPSSKNINQQ